MPSVFWLEQLGEVAADPPNVSDGFQRLPKIALGYLQLFPKPLVLS